MDGHGERRTRRDSRPPRWWHRGPFVRREVRFSVGTVLVFLFVFYVALPLAASHRAEVSTPGPYPPRLPRPRGPPRDRRPGRLRPADPRRPAPRRPPPAPAVPDQPVDSLPQPCVPGRHGPGRRPRLPAPHPIGGDGHRTPGSPSGPRASGRRWCSTCSSGSPWWRPRHPWLPRAGRAPRRRSRPTARSCIVAAAAVGAVLLGRARRARLPARPVGQERARQVVRRIGERLRFVDADRWSASVEDMAAGSRDSWPTVR